MNERRIRLSGAQDAREFVSGASKCSFDVDVFYNRVVIDAKSLMGVLSMDLNQVLTVKYGGRDAEFENILDKYAVC